MLRTAASFILLGTLIEASEIYRTPRRPVREVLLSNKNFTTEMIEELLITSENITQTKYPIPLHHLLYDDMIGLTDEIVTEFSDIVKLDSIGQSYENRSIRMLVVSARNESTAQTKAKSFLITGAHHSRELSSIQIPLLTLLTVLHHWLHGD